MRPDEQHSVTWSAPAFGAVGRNLCAVAGERSRERPAVMSWHSDGGLELERDAADEQGLPPQCGRLLPAATLPAWPDGAIGLRQRWGNNSSLVLVVHPGASHSGKLGPSLSRFHAWGSCVENFRTMSYEIALLSADGLAEQRWLEGARKDGLVVLSDEALLLAEPLKLPVLGDDQGYVYGGLTLILHSGEVTQVFEPSSDVTDDVAIALEFLRMVTS